SSDLAFILATGPFAMWKLITLILIGGILFYGMLISGTRGAFFVLSGGLVGLFLMRNFKLLIAGCIIGIGLVAFLKFSTIGNDYYAIRRLRTAVNQSEDASFVVRLATQLALR